MKTDNLQNLLVQLASEDSNEAQDAQYEIQSEYGLSAIEPILGAFSGFNHFSMRCEIELISDVLDQAPEYKNLEEIEKAVVPYLRSEDEVTRTWVADLLADVGSKLSVPPLQELLASARTGKTPPDWSEPTSVRRALRKLGALERETPDIVKNKMVQDTVFDESWLLSDVTSVVESLVDHKLVVINFQLWALSNGKYYWAEENKYENHELDFKGDWKYLLDASKDNAFALIKRVKVKKDYRATFDWVSQSD